MAIVNPLKFTACRKLIVSIVVLITVIYAIIIIHDVNIRDKYLTAIKADTVESYTKFISEYPESEYTYEAIRKRDSIAFKNAKEENRLESYANFIRIYPDSEWKPNAVYYRDKIELERAKKDNTLKSIVTFLRNHPDSLWIDKARYHLRHQFGYEHESEVTDLSE